MVTFYILLLIPIVWGIFAKFGLHKTISWFEMFSMIAVTSVLITVVYWSGTYSQMYDQQVLNGHVTAKESTHVHCRHSYDCNCRNVVSCSGSGNSRSCSSMRVCDTCYEHSYDIDWDVHTTIGNWTIDTIDRQGLKEPPRWTIVKLSDPVSKTDSYVNYVKAVPESLFNVVPVIKDRYKGMLPNYPIGIYDYYKVDRFITNGVTVSDAALWNSDIAYMLGQIGASKQVNVIVIITSQKDSAYSKALQAAWIGGKKNDAVIVIGAPNYPKIEWVDVFAWSKNNIFNVQLRDDIFGAGEVKREVIVPLINKNMIKNYVRRPMAEFAYLKDQIEPPSWVIYLTIILSLCSMFGLTILFHRVDLIEVLSGRSSKRKYY